MTGFGGMWLPILLSSVFIFILSSIVHMVLPWHKSDYPKMPGEDRVLETFRSLPIPPGDYMIPLPSSRKEMRSPEFIEKLRKGPILVLTLRRGGSVRMGSSLAQWFVYCIIVGVFAAYIAGRALPPGSPYLAVFRFTGATAFIGYSLALWQMVIWYRRSWVVTLKSTIDGLLYALVTAGIFGWLWPR